MTMTQDSIFSKIISYYQSFNQNGRSDKLHELITSLATTITLITALFCIIGVFLIVYRNWYLNLPIGSIDIQQIIITATYFATSFFACVAIDHVLNIMALRQWLGLKFCLIRIVVLTSIWLIISAILEPLVHPETPIITFGYSLIAYILLTILPHIFKASITIRLIIFAVVSLTTVLLIPQNIGGLRGQTVELCYFDDSNCVVLEHYGINKGLYYFMNDESIILLPIDQGYIRYPKGYIQKQAD